MKPLAQKPDLVAMTHDAIRGAIMSGELAPCAPLAQEDLALRLGVSRQPISHALALLKREGLVVERGRKGQMVAPIDAERLLALYQVRGALDSLAARLAALRARDGIDMQPVLSALIEKGLAAVGAARIDALVETDVAFHRALYELSGNDEIAQTADGAWPHMVRSMRVVLEDVTRHHGIWKDHQAIADAIVAGDADTAARLAGEHTERAGEATYRRLKATSDGQDAAD